MIVPMKKVSLIVMGSEKAQVLEELRGLGVLHVRDKAQSSEAWSELDKRRRALKKVLAYMDREALPLPPEAEQPAAAPPAGMSVDQVVQMAQQDQGEMGRLQEERAANRKEMDRIAAWGRFDPELVRELADTGVRMGLYAVPEDRLEGLFPGDMRFIPLEKEKKLVRGAALCRNPDTEFPEAYRVDLPEKGYDELEARQEEIDNELERLEKERRDLAGYRTKVQKELELVQQDMEFQEVADGMGREEDLVYLTGFIPEDGIPAFRKAADKGRWAYLLEDPREEDPVPTKLKNNRVVNMIKPIFQVLGTTPGYREYDISSYFLFFFAIFVAMIIGDAGYGMLFLGASLGMHISGLRKGSRANLANKLLYTLSLTTVAWGAVTGNWFGSRALASWEPLKALVIPQIATFPELYPNKDVDSQAAIMFICFVLGAIQISIAHIKGFLAKVPRLKSLADLGWLSMVLGLYYLVLNLVLGREMPGFAMPVIFGGLAAVLLFGSQEPGQPFLKGVLMGIAGGFTTFLDSISAFADIMSYIRLFAVGMASFSIASSFNAMAEPLMGGWGMIGAVLILLFGHSLNIVMGILSIFVHGIRLNMLEFSGHLNMEWSGIPYRPFEKKTG